MKIHLRTGILKIAQAMEFILAILILVAISGSAILHLTNSAQTLAAAPAAFSITEFLSQMLFIIMGIEFVKMLVLHTPNAVTDVLLFAIARQMIASHSSPAEMLLGVGAVAGIFAIKKYLSVVDTNGLPQNTEKP